MQLRNWLFDNDLIRSIRPAIYSISVGNLTVGGTGKTPMVEFLIERYLRAGTEIAGSTATLSRGYGRQTRGFRIAANVDTAGTIGDEPLQLYRKFAPLVRVCVGERRVAALEALQQRHPETKRVLLDDAFQHRPVRPHLNLLLTDYNRPFYRDYPFPAGRLREGRKGARRADGIIVTKCPLSTEPAEQQRIRAEIQRYARPETPVFLAGLHYSHPVSFATRQSVATLRSVVLVSGLANADPLAQYVRQTFGLQQHYRYADHYTYSRAELAQMLAALPPDTALLTTEKDWVKLDALLTPDERASAPCYYLPVRVAFLDDQASAFARFLDAHTLKNR